MRNETTITFQLWNGPKEVTFTSLQVLTRFANEQANYWRKLDADKIHGLNDVVDRAHSVFQTLVNSVNANNRAMTLSDIQNPLMHFREHVESQKHVPFLHPSPAYSFIEEMMAKSSALGTLCMNILAGNSAVENKNYSTRLKAQAYYLTGQFIEGGWNKESPKTRANAQTLRSLVDKFRQKLLNSEKEHADQMVALRSALELFDENASTFIQEQKTKHSDQAESLVERASLAIKSITDTQSAYTEHMQLRAAVRA